MVLTCHALSPVSNNRVTNGKCVLELFHENKMRLVQHFPVHCRFECDVHIMSVDIPTRLIPEETLNTIGLILIFNKQTLILVEIPKNVIYFELVCYMRSTIEINSLVGGL